MRCACCVLATFFLGLRPFLRSKANLGLPPFFSSLCQLTGGTLIGSVLGRLVADVQIQVGAHADSFLALGDIFVRARLDQEAGFLEANGAVRRPGVADHFGDQLAFHIVSRLFGLHIALEQVIILGLAFTFEHFEGAAKTVLAAVLGDLFPACVGAGPGTFLRVGAVGCELRL